MSGGLFYFCLICYSKFLIGDGSALSFRVGGCVCLGGWGQDSYDVGVGGGVRLVGEQVVLPYLMDQEWGVAGGT